MRRLAVLLVLLAGVAGVVELVGPRVVEGAVAARVQQESGLAARPEVELRDRPFLSQALRGRYDDIVVRSQDVPAGQVELDSVVTQLTHVQVPLASVLTGQLEVVRVGRVSTRAVVRYDTLTAAVADRGLQVTPADTGRLRVTGRVDVLGRTLSAAAVSRPSLEDRTVVITAERFELGNDVADEVVSRALGDALDFDIALDPLPYGLQLRSVDARPDGVVLTAQATDAVLR